MADFKLKPVTEVPASTRGGGSSLYSDILASFAGMAEDQVEVQLDGKKPLTILQGLTKVKKASAPTFDAISIVKRGDRIFLTK